MDASEQLKDDLRTGRLEATRLVGLVVILQCELHTAKQTGVAHRSPTDYRTQTATRWATHTAKSQSRFPCGLKNSGSKHAAPTRNPRNGNTVVAA